MGGGANVTWGEFKQAVEAKGVKDSTDIQYIECVADDAADVLAEFYLPPDENTVVIT